MSNSFARRRRSYLFHIETFMASSTIYECIKAKKRADQNINLCLNNNGMQEHASSMHHQPAFVSSLSLHLKLPSLDQLLPKSLNPAVSLLKQFFFF